MSLSAGILTARGGLASHAAVVARGWGIPAVVGASGIEVRDGEVVIGGQTLRDGDTITIDGASGEVFEGEIPGHSEPVPQARTLLAWAAELGVPIGAGDEPEPSTAPAEAPASAPVTLDSCIRRLATKGFATTPALADSLLTTPEAVQPLLDQLVVDGVAATVAGAYRLTEAGSSRGAELAAADRVAWGVEPATAALDAFLELDHRMKETVTAWQLKPGPDGEPQPNDHGDEAYDREILDRLERSVPTPTSGWRRSRPHRQGWAVTGSGCARALERAGAGDGKYVASPRVDSFHGAWFELHEDLIILAGRTRADETAAGRA